MSKFYGTIDFTPIQLSILRYLHEHKGDQIIRADICLEFYGDSKKNRTTVFDNLKKLEDRDFVERYKIHNGKRGPPLKGWRLKEDEKSINLKRIEAIIYAKSD